MTIQSIKNSLNRPSACHGLFPITLALACFALFPVVQAVVPPPAGGYPGGNTANGQSALLSLTSGGYNTAIGFLSLRSDTDASFNTGLGAATLFANTGEQNTAIGAAALLSNTTGHANTANGAFALLNNTLGIFNSALGANALTANTTGYNNTAVGFQALASNTIGNFNTATGVVSLFRNTTGMQNTATGDEALLSNTTGGGNTATGFEALLSNTTGESNTATGLLALGSNTEGSYNTAIGPLALASNTTGVENTTIGYEAITSNTTGSSNTAIGIYALSNSTGNSNTALGQRAGVGVTTADNVICIGAPGADVSNSCYIGGIAGQTVGLGGSACYVDNDGKLGVFLSARRFKTDIADMGNASAGLLALRPVTFHYKPELDKARIPQFGLVAEEVEAVNPDLVVHDKDGKVSTVRYEAVNAMLLNEFLKQHRKVEEQQATITQLKKDFGATIAQLIARLDEQAAQIQKVSAQLELNKSAPQTVLNLKRAPK
ncbi:MAG: tail fiber domain-containing protein [Nitrospirota bacterium]